MSAPADDTQRVEGGIPVYDWRMAPPHLRTRRQLEAQGLRRNGQDIAGKIPFRRYGREQVAHLYDINLAAQKRQATPAQLAALEKATREHQLRAAERHGVDRAELEQAGDPGPGWAIGSTPCVGVAGSEPVFAGLMDRSHDRDDLDQAGDPGSAWPQTSALANYRPGSALADAVARSAEREGMDR
ncbi:RRQRL motif-containing zinc-binding protein [Nocardia vinacea]|uniref:RRQRL motif-containing zinc-binding protein n=1 Tax=Nocardia vinacea TaxID=96468 RepID=UPI000683EB82|nr:RRQRL motif-containing zinc-binding protein [Nocardia vinacea]